MRSGSGREGRRWITAGETSEIETGEDTPRAGEK